jgi:tRNA(Ile)-lysidine synthase
VTGPATARFAADLAALLPTGTRFGIAVSGGPDSLALLRLAAETRAGAVEAATVDHRLRDGSRGEAEAVARVCGDLAVPHTILTARWATPPAANRQARARDERYALLGEWAVGRGLAAIATAHHTDDQAETVLMRLARGAGLRGLAGIRPVVTLRDSGAELIRPLLGWRKQELEAIAAAAGLAAADDPSNRDLRHDRARMREWLAQAGWADPLRLAATAGHLRDADDALDWALAPLLTERLTERDGALRIDPAGLPRELQRRLLLAAFARLGAGVPRGPELIAALDRLLDGETTTLAGLKLEGGRSWRLGPAPPRRS